MRSFGQKILSWRINNNCIEWSFVCVCVFPGSQDRKEIVLTLTGGRPCAKLMTKNGNDRMIELFWRKGKKQWSIKKAGLQELCFCQTSYMQSPSKRRVPEQGSETDAGQRRKMRLWSLPGSEIKARPWKWQGQGKDRMQASRSKVSREWRELYPPNSACCFKY